MRGGRTLRCSSMGSAGCLTTKISRCMVRQQTATRELELVAAGPTTCTKCARKVRLHLIFSGRYVCCLSKARKNWGERKMNEGEGVGRLGRDGKTEFFRIMEFPGKGSLLSPPPRQIIFCRIVRALRECFLLRLSK